MRYLIRAVKYFLYICIIFTVIILALVLLKAVSPDVNVMFKYGWKSIGLIAAMFAAVSAFYPLFGYAKRLAAILGELTGYRQDVIDYMSGRGYRFESEEGEAMTFRSRNFMTKLIWDDRITIEKGLGGFYVEGPGREVVKIVSGLEYKFHNPDEQQD